MINSIWDLCRMLGIGLYRYSENIEWIKLNGIEKLLTAKGFVYERSSGELRIFYDDSQSIQEMRRTIAHELGHIFQGHLGEDRVRAKKLGDPVLEQEADSTAAVLLNLIYGSGWEEQMDVSA